MSIGHVAPVLYATLANAGYFDRSELKTLRKFQSRLQGHPSLESGLPGIETSSGSLGQGLGITVGMALANKIDGKNNRIYCIMGDGELQEGSVWESAMSASHYHLHNIIAFIDRNNCQIDGRTSSVMNIEPLAEKWKSFGWHVEECDGHDFLDLLQSHQNCLQISNQPSVIIAKTKMGKGIPEIEDNYLWHGKVPSIEQGKKFKEILLKLMNYKVKQLKPSRFGFGEGVLEAAKTNSEIIGLGADITSSVSLNFFSEHFPIDFSQSV